MFFKLACAFVLSVVTVGWTWASRRRERFHQNRSIKTSDFVTAETLAGGGEGVGVVLPVRGVVSNRREITGTRKWRRNMEGKSRSCSWWKKRRTMRRKRRNGS